MAFSYSKELQSGKVVIKKAKEITSGPMSSRDSKIAFIKEKLKSRTLKSKVTSSESLVFDIPVTYNQKVRKWIEHFQKPGQKWFRQWLTRSSRYLPFIQKELREASVPTDLAFMVMIESGFSSHATSWADAVGPWQFIEPTGNRYGLQKNHWLDERRDLLKSTKAAICYLKDLYTEFGSWYLVAASYNMGESGLRRRIQKYGTNDYWKLIQLKALPKETEEYVPKILAAMLISKAPNLYGFRDIAKAQELRYDLVTVPGGTQLSHIANEIGVTHQALKDLNAELLLGYIPQNISSHSIRVPLGAATLLSGNYVAKKPSSGFNSKNENSSDTW